MYPLAFDESVVGTMRDTHGFVADRFSAGGARRFGDLLQPVLGLRVLPEDGERPWLGLRVLAVAEGVGGDDGGYRASGIVAAIHAGGLVKDHLHGAPCIRAVRRIRGPGSRSLHLTHVGERRSERGDNAEALDMATSREDGVGCMGEAGGAD